MSALLCRPNRRSLMPILALTTFLGIVPTALAQGDPSEVGLWSNVSSWPRVAVHAMLLPTGRVLFYPYNDDARVWDPQTNTLTSPARPGYNTFCNGHSLMADGSLFIAGGHIQNGVGLPRASIYNPFTNIWRHLPDMNAGRWYPTNTTLANGDVLVTSGSIDNTVGANRLPQVWETDGGRWRDLTSAQLSLPLYPWQHVAPDGRVFVSGPGQATRYLDTTGTGTWTTVGDRTFGSRSYGSSVMYYPGWVLVMGGADPPTETAEVINLYDVRPTWRRVGPMANRRRQINATILANGQVLVTGGSSGPGFDNRNFPVFTAELWDPWTETWTSMASNQRYRGYHSTALLLPDGRVLSSGGDDQPNMEIYSPPYLFLGSRPRITDAPAQVAYEETFFVATPDTASIDYITFLRLGSATHAFDMEQRIAYLDWQTADDGLLITAPSGPTLAPPGYYMLFLVNQSGVPSGAWIILLG